MLFEYEVEEIRDMIEKKLKVELEVLYYGGYAPEIEEPLRNTIVLSRRLNQFNENIPEKEINIYDTLIMYAEINCYSSSDHGLGTCRCASHTPWNFVLFKIKKLL